MYLHANSLLVVRCGVLTVEIEHVDVATLEKLEQQGVDCQPKASTIRIIQVSPFSYQYIPSFKLCYSASNVQFVLFNFLAHGYGLWNVSFLDAFLAKHELSLRDLLFSLGLNEPFIVLSLEFKLNFLASANAYGSWNGSILNALLAEHELILGDFFFRKNLMCMLLH